MYLVWRRSNSRSCRRSAGTDNREGRDPGGYQRPEPAFRPRDREPYREATPSGIVRRRSCEDVAAHGGRKTKPGPDDEIRRGGWCHAKHVRIALGIEPRGIRIRAELAAVYRGAHRWGLNFVLPLRNAASPPEAYGLHDLRFSDSGWRTAYPNDNLQCQTNRSNTEKRLGSASI